MKLKYDKNLYLIYNYKVYLLNICYYSMFYIKFLF
jgi:hypothetical protein